MGRGREEIAELLNDGKRGLREIGKIMRIYDEEIKNKNESPTSEKKVGGEGIAKRIVEGQKLKLNKVGSFGYSEYY